MTACAVRAVEPTGRIRLNTRFGVFEANPLDILSFPQGLPGFERCQQFILLSSSEMAPFQCLHAVSGAAASFVVIEPRFAVPRYRCPLTEPVSRLLGAGDGTSLLYLALVTVGADSGATVNLRAPIVVNPERMVGSQVVLENSQYSMRFPLKVE
jgi:flagellar assembly factor FliW